MGDIHLIGVDKDGKPYGLDKNDTYGIAIAGVIDGGYRAIVRYGVNTPGYPKFVAMMLAAYIDGGYCSLKGDIPAFNGFASLTTNSAQTTSVAPMRFSTGRNKIEGVKRHLSLGERIETASF